MIVCEYFFKEFYSRGSDEYFWEWAREIDLLAEEGWKVLDSVRQPHRLGYWTVVLGRPEHAFRSELIGWRFEDGKD